MPSVSHFSNLKTNLYCYSERRKVGSSGHLIHQYMKRCVPPTASVFTLRLLMPNTEQYDMKKLMKYTYFLPMPIVSYELF